MGFWHSPCHLYCLYYFWLNGNFVVIPIIFIMVSSFVKGWYCIVFECVRKHKGMLNGPIMASGPIEYRSVTSRKCYFLNILILALDPEKAL